MTAPVEQVRGDEGDQPVVRPEGKVLRCEGLRKSYRGRRVVDDVSVEIRQGEVVGLLGPNGAGKTTTFYCMLGLETPDAGKVYLGDMELTHDPIYVRARKGISYLPQEKSIFRRMSVEQNLLAILETLPIPPRERIERMESLIADLGLQKVRKNQGYQLSGGECRRTEIARALVTGPSFLLLDEPFAGIDPRAVEDIQRIVAQLAGRGIGVLITDHNVQHAFNIIDWACIINQGRIFRTGAPADLAADPEVRKVYLGDSFRLH
jgi:lipopolysaccharide export system ATP-binding protein